MTNTSSGYRTQQIMDADKPVCACCGAKMREPAPFVDWAEPILCVWCEDEAEFMNRKLEDWEKVLVLLYLCENAKGTNPETLARTLFDWPEDRSGAAFAEAHLRGMVSPDRRREEGDSE